MARIEKTVFISYRRTDVYTALAVYENLKNQGYDVFFDYRSISSGDFEQIITSNIRARAHFLLILTPTALDRCNEPGDWLRREIEIAIDEKRNIIPLFFKGFRFGVPSLSDKLTGKLKNLSRYNGLNVHEDYFDEAMQRVRMQFLNIPLNTILHPVSTEVQKVVKAEQVAADQALEKIEDVKELAKQAEDKPKAELAPKPVPVVVPEKQQQEENPKPERELQPKPVASEPKTTEREALSHTIVKKWALLNPRIRLFIVVASILLLVPLCIMSGVDYISNNVFEFVTVTVTPEPTRTSQLPATNISQPPKTNTPTPTKTLIPPTPTLGIGSTMTSDKDGMTLLYVPAGEFIMGSSADDALAECQKFRSGCQRSWFTYEEPQHTVSLNTFWIDKTEVTLRMYNLCVEAGVCKEPISKTSFTNSSYYSNAEFDNYPVIHVDWKMAKTYCEWADRRLPTEAEWEKAARGTDANIYPWGNTFDGSLVNFCDKNCSFDWADKSSDDRYADVAPVGSYPTGRSVYGAVDMAGNVLEWVSSLYQPYPYNVADGREDLDSSNERVLRGGAWIVNAIGVRSTYRNTDDFFSSDLFGFRCAMSTMR